MEIIATDSLDADLGIGNMETKWNAIRRHTELVVYRAAFANAMKVFELTKSFPKEERYSLVDQIRRTSRSVWPNLAEAWRKRRYQAAFISRLTDSEAEAAETQVWIQFAMECGYLSGDEAKPLSTDCDEIIAMLVSMINHPEHWTLRR